MVDCPLDQLVTGAIDHLFSMIYTQHTAAFMLAQSNGPCLQATRLPMPLGMHGWTQHSLSGVFGIHRQRLLEELVKLTQIFAPNLGPKSLAQISDPNLWDSALPGTIDALEKQLGQRPSSSWSAGR